MHITVNRLEDLGFESWKEQEIFNASYAQSGSWAYPASFLVFSVECFFHR